MIIFGDVTEGISPEGVCSSYHGTICKGYLRDTGRIWFNNSQEHVGGEENENIVKGLWKEMIATYSEPCRSAAEVGLFVFSESSRFVNLNLDSLLKNCCTFSFIAETVVHLCISIMWL